MLEPFLTRLESDVPVLLNLSQLYARKSIRKRLPDHLAEYLGSDEEIDKSTYTHRLMLMDGPVSRLDSQSDSQTLGRRLREMGIGHHSLRRPRVY